MIEIIGTYLRESANGAWRGVIRYDDGKEMRQATKTLESRDRNAARRELRRWAVEFEAEGSGRKRRKRTPKVKACDYIAGMVDDFERMKSVEPSTIKDYRATLRRLRTVLGDIELSRITHATVREMIAGLCERGYSSATVGKTYRLLRQACARACLDDLIQTNPCDGAKPPKRKPAKPGINFARRDTRERIMAQLSSVPMTYTSTAAVIALYTGMREGEVCGLRWGDVEQDVIWVRRAVGVREGGKYLKSSKTDRTRDVVIPQTLRRWLDLWRRVLGNPGPSTFVLTGTEEFVHPHTLSRVWSATADALGLVGSEGRRLGFHDLRHTWATVAVAAGVDIKTVASNLGHSSAAMTLNIYASEDPEAKIKAAQVMDGVI